MAMTRHPIAPTMATAMRGAGVWPTTLVTRPAAAVEAKNVVLAAPMWERWAAAAVNPEVRAFGDRGPERAVMLL